jgi:hypothetical protein
MTWPVGAEPQTRPPARIWGIWMGPVIVCETPHPVVSRPEYAAADVLGMRLRPRHRSRRQDRELFPCVAPPQPRRVNVGGALEEDTMHPYFQTAIESEARYHRQQLANDFRRTGGRERVGIRDPHERRWHVWRRDSS